MLVYWVIQVAQAQKFRDRRSQDGADRTAAPRCAASLAPAPRPLATPPPPQLLIGGQFVPSTSGKTFEGERSPPAARFAPFYRLRAALLGAPVCRARPPALLSSTLLPPHFSTCHHVHTAFRLPSCPIPHSCAQSSTPAPRRLSSRWPSRARRTWTRPCARRASERVARIFGLLSCAVLHPYRLCCSCTSAVALLHKWYTEQA